MARTRAARAWLAWVWLVSAATLGVAAGPVLASEERRVTVVERVIDGDTFVIAGGARVRVRNFDTPELRTYECRAERAAAMAARDRARALLQGQRVTLRLTGADRYRRMVADVAVHRGGATRDFVAEMVASGHGKRWAYGREPQPTWCGGQSQSASWRWLWELLEQASGGGRS